MLFRIDYTLNRHIIDVSGMQVYALFSGREPGSSYTVLGELRDTCRFSGATCLEANRKGRQRCHFGKSSRLCRTFASVKRKAIQFRPPSRKKYVIVGHFWALLKVGANMREFLRKWGLWNHFGNTRRSYKILAHVRGPTKKPDLNASDM